MRTIDHDYHVCYRDVYRTLSNIRKRLLFRLLNKRLCYLLLIRAMILLQVSVKVKGSISCVSIVTSLSATPLYCKVVITTGYQGI